MVQGDEKVWMCKGFITQNDLKIFWPTKEEAKQLAFISFYTQLVLVMVLISAHLYLQRPHREKMNRIDAFHDFENYDVLVRCSKTSIIAGHCVVTEFSLHWRSV